MDERQIRRDTKKVVRKVIKIVDKHDAIGRQELDAIHHKVVDYVHKHTGISREEITQKRDTVIRDLPNEFGTLDPTLKSWEALIAYLYMKYLKELGFLRT